MSEFIKGKRYRIIGDTCIPNKNGDILIFKREYYDDARIGVFNDGNVDHFYYYKRFDPTPLPDPIEYTPEVVHCTWCGEPVLFPESHKYCCIHQDNQYCYICGNFLYLCDKCRGSIIEDVDRCYCSEHVEQHRPREEDEIDYGTDYTESDVEPKGEDEMQSGCEIIKCGYYINNECTDKNEYIDKDNGEACCGKCENAILIKDYDVSTDDTANAGIAAVMFGSKPKQTYAEKTWKGPSKEEMGKKKFVEEERRRYGHTEGL